MEGFNGSQRKREDSIPQDNENKTASVDQRKNAKFKKGSGCFRIPKKSMETLIDHKATAWQIGVFLAIARYSDASGRFSSAGYKSIYKATGASPGLEKKPGRGRQLTQELLRAGRQSGEPVNPKKKTKKLSGILYTAEEWFNKTGELIPEVPHDLYSIKWVLNDYETDEWVWFPNSLVDGHGMFKQPLKRLKQCGDVAARLLLLLYDADDMEEFGGVPPLDNVYRKYDLNHLTSCNGFTFWSAAKGEISCYYRLALPSIGIDKFSKDGEEKEKQWKAFWNALYSLENSGFIYECITAMDGTEINQDTRPLYDIVTRPKHGHPLKGEEGLVKRINRIFEKKACGHTDTSGRYNGTYPVLSFVGVMLQVIGIYRLRFRITNPKNYPVKAAWIRIQNDRNDWSEHLEQLEKIFDLKSENKPSFDDFGVPEDGRNAHNYPSVSDDIPCNLN